jgi:hypothetical protein
MNESLTIIISATIVAVSMILAILIYNLQQDNLKSKNMEHAISKGIDPLSVRCSYAQPQDLLCVAYASSKK